MELFRPVSAREYRAIEERNFEGFPKRTEEQPILTVLLSQEGAMEIARRMRVEKQKENKVFVVSFLVEDSYIRQFPVQILEEPDYSALWIPADETEILNQHLIGKIRLVTSYQIDREDCDVFFA
ncbi:MAG: hypothetical protein J6S92_09035 [Oscillospiraceae bacterium]|nr:hypothetical protein [Oscillospiraceae bacterium]